MRKLEWDDTGDADRIRRNMWMHRSSAESTKDDVHAERMDLGCPIPLTEDISDAPATFIWVGTDMMNDLTPELGRRRRAAWGA
ncbi:hypothetical protein RB195_000728 [Necator americanus]|uniref:Uncharacterized protein n=1 Tax=Necator americanus TaxID=51031 RepID=A0ABR1DB37_NECAM